MSRVVEGLVAWTVCSLTALGFLAILGAVIRLTRDVFRRGGHRPAQPDELPMGPAPAPRPPGPFGAQTFPIHPRPGGPDYEQSLRRGPKIRPSAPWPPSPLPRSAIESIVEEMIGVVREMIGRVEALERSQRLARFVAPKTKTVPGREFCTCTTPRWEVSDLTRGTRWCYNCRRDAPPWRPLPGEAFADGGPGWAVSTAWNAAEQAARWGE